MSIQVQPATADRWNDLVTMFGRRGEAPSCCLCQLFLPSGTHESSASGPVPDNREALRHEITHAPVPPGLIAYDENAGGLAGVGEASVIEEVPARA